MTTSWLVRRATVQDAALLAELAAETFPLACPPGFDPDAIRLHIQRRLSADAFRINLADVAMEYTVALRTGDGAVGYLLLTGLATAIAAAGVTAARSPRAIPVRVRSRCSVRVVRRD